MNKIYMTKRGVNGKTVVCSEKTRARGKVKSLVMAIVAGGATMLTCEALAAEATSTGGAVVAVGDNIGGVAVTAQGTANATGVNAYAVGRGANAQGAGSMAVGQNARAIGSLTDNITPGVLAVGSGASATNTSAVALGQNSSATGYQSIAIGYHAKAEGDDTTQSTNQIAIGSSAEVSADRAIAIGQYTKSLHRGAVSLGFGSVSEAATTTPSATIGSLRLDNFAGPSHSVVSIGENELGVGGGVLIKRQIVNVAAGRVSETSTDAVNGSQLYALATTTSNFANSIKQGFGGNADLNTNGTITMTNIGGTGKDNIHDAIAFVNAKQGGSSVNVVQGDGITITDATANGEKSFIVGLASAVKADIETAKTDAAKGIVDAAAADAKAVAAQNTATAAKATADTIAATTYKFTVSNGESAGSATNGDADTWKTTEADSLTLAATTDLSVTTDGAGKVIYGLSDATKQSITKAQTDATAANTAVDALKPIVDKNTADIASLKDTKADKSYVDAELAKKADKADLEALKDGITTTIQPALDAKADKADVDAKNAEQDAAIAQKADKSYVDAQNQAQDTKIADNKAAIDGLDGRVTAAENDIASLEDNKADKTYVDAQNAAQDTVIATKADKADVDAKNALQDAIIDTKADKTALAVTDAKLAALDAVAVTYDDTTKDTITLAGADGTTITNVADGRIAAGSKDAVNGGQLAAVVTANEARFDAMAARQDGFDLRLDGFHNRMNKMENRLDGGIANAMAMANLPTPYEPSTHHVMFGTGFYHGEAAVALGATGTHESGKTSYKVGLSWSDAGGFGGGVGGSYRWK